MSPSARKRQFRALYRVFLLRIIDLELLSSRGDPHRIMAQLAAIFAAIGFTFILSKAYRSVIAGSEPQPPVAAWAEQEFLIATSMAVAGLIATINWSSVFPSRLDMLVLGATPVQHRTVILAKAASFATVVFAAVTSLNAVTGIIYPFLTTPVDAGPGGVLRAFAAYWLTTAAAAWTICCALIALHGAFAVVLRHGAFLRASSYVQVGGVLAVIAGYFLKPPLAANADDWILFSPSIWFLGLFQKLNGASAFDQLAIRAVTAAIVTGASAALFFVLGSLRAVGGVVEQRHVAPARPPQLIRWLTHSLCPDWFEQNLFLFMIRTLVRSRPHRLMFTAWLGAGAAMALVFLRASIYDPRTDWGAPALSLLGFGFVFLFFVILGIRCLATIPCELRANWIFRLTEFRRPLAYLRATRRTLLLTVAAPACVSLAVVYATLWPLGLAVRHSVLLALFSMIILGLMLRDFRKIPFTCSYLPGKTRLNVRLGACGLLFLFVCEVVLRTELWALRTTPRFVLLAGTACAGAWWATRRARLSVTSSSQGLVFDETPAADLYALDLSESPSSAEPVSEDESRNSSAIRWVAVMLFLLVAGAVWQSVAEWQDRSRFPRAGHAIDIGGRSLNLHCAGEGRPAVVFDSGLNAPGYSWALVQRKVATVTRACWFDRAGYGWSDPGPPPRTSEVNARETRQMLHAAGIEPPWVLVGHSYGGFNARVFADRYRHDVAALILVDAAYENDETDPRLRAGDPAIRRLLPDPALDWLARLWPWAGRFGLVRLFANPPAAQGQLSGEDAARIHALQLQAKSMDALVMEGQARSVSMAQVRQIRSFGDLPLIVITGGKTRSRAFYRTWVEDIQAGFSRLSTKGRHLVVPTSGHAVPFEAPEAIAEAILGAIAAHSGSSALQQTENTSESRNNAKNGGRE